MKQKKPDELSLEFMAFAIRALNDRVFYMELVDSIYQDAEMYYAQPIGNIKKDLYKKLWKGSIEHGPPIHELEWIEKEMKQELIDLIGYKLLYLWNEKQK